MLVGGDFNAHLGALGGIRGTGEPNQQGVLLADLLDRCEMYAPSLSSIANGPSYTYRRSSEVRTTVDYVLADCEASHLVHECWVHDQHDLNTSDHLPISVQVEVHPEYGSHQPQMKSKVNWNKAKELDLIPAYAAAVNAIIPSFIGKSYDTAEEIDVDICKVSGLLKEAAQKTLPELKPKKPRRRWFQDRTLSVLSSQSRNAWIRWNEAGRPINGSLYKEKNKLRQELRKRFKILAAIGERKKIQSFDARFKQNRRDQFRKPTIKSRQGVKLRVNGKTTSDLVMQTWVDHFKDTGRSRVNEMAPVASANKEMQGLVTESFVNVETVLDIPFIAEEIETAIKRLKVGKAGGDDDIQPEHIKFGGHQLTVWLLQICNSIVDLEDIPSTMKMGVLCPLYKGGGKDPLETGSYRGIALTSVWAKLLEILILQRLLPIMEDLDLPHINQTGYRKGNSCADAVFASLEVISQFVNDGDKVYMCLYDLQKAYDSVEYSILFKRLYEAGIYSKCWRLIKAWYHQPNCKVKVDGRTSSSFAIERGVRQGSVLSPALFLIVMNPLLQRMQQLRLGATVHSLYAGIFAHADDIRTITSSKESMELQINLILSFTQESGLTLNPQKCEVVVMSKTKHPKEVVCRCDQQQLIPKDAAKCLGFWWSWNLAANTAVDEAVKKARHTFFLFGGMGAFQGELNPLSGRAIFETCVVPIEFFCMDVRTGS